MDQVNFDNNPVVENNEYEHDPNQEIADVYIEQDNLDSEVPIIENQSAKQATQNDLCTLDTLSILKENHSLNNSISFQKITNKVFALFNVSLRYKKP